jgi:hypothetical protein
MLKKRESGCYFRFACEDAQFGCIIIFTYISTAFLGVAFKVRLRSLSCLGSDALPVVI